jgi:hypothetical protein
MIVGKAASRPQLIYSKNNDDDDDENVWKLSISIVLIGAETAKQSTY